MTEYETIPFTECSFAVDCTTRPPTQIARVAAGKKPTGAGWTGPQEDAHEIGNRRVVWWLWSRPLPKGKAS